MAITLKPRIASATDAVKGSRCAPAKPPLTAPVAMAEKVITRLLTQPLRSLTTGPQTKLVTAPESRKLTQDSTYKLMGIGVQANENLAGWSPT